MGKFRNKRVQHLRAHHLLQRHYITTEDYAMQELGRKEQVDENWRTYPIVSS